METTQAEVLAKVTQMLDAGWEIKAWRNDLGSYSVVARQREGSLDFDSDPTDALTTDDCTLEDALTRMADKVQGQNR